MQKLPVRQRLLLGFTLFSMFFGAGNLIFPPHLGAQAGSNFWPAFAGFAVSAIGLPIAGVVAVARAGGFDQLASRVHSKFSLVFTILVYLSIGPCLAIPRTASTSFEMLVPLVGGGRGLQLSYSIVFFAAAFLVAPSGKAHRPAGPRPLPGPHRADLRPVRGLSAPPGGRAVRLPCRRLCPSARI